MLEGPYGTLLTSADSALVVVTTMAEGESAGCVVGFHSQASMSPRHYCFWLSKANHTYRVGLRARHFAIHFLTADDLPIAEAFGTRTGDDTDKFSPLEVETTEHGVPLLAACPNRLLLDRLTLLDNGGDHVCLTGHVDSTHCEDSFTPLRLSDAAHLTPGHDNDDRAIQP